MFQRLSLVVGLCLLGLPFQVGAQMNGLSISGKVVQIAGETVYVNVGRQGGWQGGQVLQIWRDGVNVGELRVIRIADRFCASNVVSVTGGIRIGDEVRGDVQKEDSGGGAKREKEVPDGNSTLDVRTQSVKVLPLASDDIPEERTLSRGKLSLRYSFSDDQSESNRDVHQPAALLDWDVSNIGGTGFRFNFRARARRRTSSRTTRPLVRLYDLGLHYESPNKGITLGVGRQNPTLVSGVGDFDGGFLKVRVGRKMHVGFFGGFQPSLQTSGFDAKAQKMGAFVNWDRTGLRFFRQNTTLAFVGEYQNGQINREYFYFQNFIWIGRKVSLFQHVAVDLDRHNQTLQNKRVQLRNAYTTLRVSPSSRFSVSVGYDARNQILPPVFETVEDSLMAVAFRQGFQGNVTLRPLRSLFLYVRGNVRMQKGEERNQAWSVGGAVTNLLGSGVRLRSRF
ncbi:MAG: hypothetical protein HOE48_26045, partial [Candidatus Latescibacteria bacterium]|nr:hypothetical protein [Candidatus Latescibacterota bacterium]